MLGTNGTVLSWVAQSGGGISWSDKTANFNASAGNGYLVDTTSGAVTATLPASPSVGDAVQLVDSASKFTTYALTVARNGNKIMGLSEEPV